jgi:phage shock protein PspC (stress-responsive transcriptional regulator)
MTCARCKKEIPEGSNYCQSCGAWQHPANRRLMRSATDKRLAGVCGGIAEYLGVDSTLVRLIWAVFSIIPGCLVGGIVAYVAAWIIMPKAPAPAPRPEVTKLDAAPAAKSL